MLCIARNGIRTFIPALLVVVLLVGLAVPAFGQGLIADLPPDLTADEVRRANNFGISVRSHVVDVSIVDQVATTTVTEVFHNPTSRQLEATFFFPLPEEASINRFSMTMNGEMVEGEVLEATQAREIYEGIVRQMRDPGLLEYVGRKLFRARIFPVTPNGDTTVVMQYTELLSADSGLVQYRYPLDTSKFTDLATSEVVVRATIESQQPLRAIYSPSHDVDLTRRGETLAIAGYEGREQTTDSDFLLYYAVDPGDIGLSLMTYNAPGEDGYFMLIATPKTDYEAHEIQPKDIVFVVDTSGSMNAGGKMDQAKGALQYCLQNLNPGDRFNIVPFSTVARQYREGLVSATPETVEHACSYVGELRATGGTAIDEALATALRGIAADADAEGRVPMVVFMTDGLPTVGERNIQRILANAGDANSANVRVFTFGVGNNVNTHLLDTLADRTRGARAYIAPEEDIEATVSSFYEKVASPVLADLQLDLGEVTGSDVFPRALPDLFKGSQMVVFGRYTGNGEQPVTLRGTVSGEEREFVFEGHFADADDSADFLPRLWALRKVGFLMDEIRLNGFNEELKDEIVRLGTRFGIVTPYTSFLVVEDEEMMAGRPMLRTRGEALRALEEAGEAMQGVAPSPDPADVPATATNSGWAEDGRARPGDTGGGNRALDEVRDHMRADGERAVRRSQFANDLRNAHSIETGGSAGSRIVGAKTFVKLRGWWIDSAFDAEAIDPADRVEIEYLSDTYFALLGDNPQLARYASVGEYCVIVFEGKAYIIAPADETTDDSGEEGTGE